MSARTATQAMAAILVVVAFVVGLAWLLDDLMPSCEIQQPEPWPRK